MKREAGKTMKHGNINSGLDEMSRAFCLETGSKGGIQRHAVTAWGMLWPQGGQGMGTRNGRQKKESQGSRESGVGRQESKTRQKSVPQS